MLFKDQRKHMPRSRRAAVFRKVAGLPVGDAFESIGDILAVMTGGRLIVADYIIMLHNICITYNFACIKIMF